MNLFIKRILLFALPILLLAAGAEVLIRKIPNDYFYKRTYLDENSKDIEVLFLGNSHAFYGFNPDYVSVKSFNAALVSQSLDYDLAILKKYDGKWNHLKYIVVPVDCFTLYGTLEESAEAWRIKNYKIYFGINIGFHPLENFEILNTKFRINLNRISDFYYKKYSPLTCSKLGWGNSYKFENKQDLKATAIKAAQRHLAATDQYFDKMSRYLNDIVAYAAKNNVKVVLITSPAYKTYSQIVNAEQLNRTTNAINKVTASNSNVTYFNLLSDTTFSENDFFDADHLNEFGAKKLTLKIDSLLPALK